MTMVSRIFKAWLESRRWLGISCGLSIDSFEGQAFYVAPWKGLPTSKSNCVICQSYANYIWHLFLVCTNSITSWNKVNIQPLLEELMDVVESFGDVFTRILERLSMKQLVSFDVTSLSIWKRIFFAIVGKRNWNRPILFCSVDRQRSMLDNVLGEYISLRPRLSGKHRLQFGSLLGMIC